MLSDAVKTRLTVENDDKLSLYTVQDLMYIYDKVKVPIVFDYHHYNCQQDPMSEREARLLAATTWPACMKPVVHYSESKALHENNNKLKPQAHSDYITKLPDLHGADADIMVEAKAKELAILPFIQNKK